MEWHFVLHDVQINRKHFLFFTTRYNQNRIWVTEVRFLSHMVEEVTPSLRLPIFALQQLQTSHTFLEFKETQSHLHTSPR